MTSVAFVPCHPIKTTPFTPSRRLRGAQVGSTCQRQNAITMSHKTSRTFPSLPNFLISISIATLSLNSLPSAVSSATIPLHQQEVTTNVTHTTRNPSSTSILKLVSSRTRNENHEADTENPTPPPSPTVSSHRSKGDKLATYLNSLGIPPSLVVLLIAALPVLELRAAIPVGLLLFNLPMYKTFILSVVGNLLPLPLILGVLQLPFIQAFSDRILSRARRLASSIGNSSSKLWALALFVGIPLPGTGAWTGTLVAFVLNMPTAQATAALLTGILMAAAIVTALCELGWIGAAIAGSVLTTMAIVAIVRALKAGRSETENAVRLEESDDISKKIIPGEDAQGNTAKS